MKNISNVVIVHGANEKDRENIKKYNLPPQNMRGWLLWTKNQLKQKGINCIVPLMPKNWNPDYGEWKKEFEKYFINKKSVLIGYSAGGAFLVRYLGDTKKKVKKLILVAPSKILPNSYRGCFKKFYNFKIDKQIKDNINKIYIFMSDDSYCIIRGAERYHSKLGGELIYLPNRGHFTEHSMGTKEFPELLEKILE